MWSMNANCAQVTKESIRCDIVIEKKVMQSPTIYPSDRTVWPPLHITMRRIF